MIKLTFIISSISLSLLLNCGNLNEVLNSTNEVFNPTNDPTDQEIGIGLKEALVLGTSTGVSFLSKEGGYLDHPRFKIPFPKSAQKVENTLRDMGLNNQVDQVVTSLNRAAENAVTEAKPLFVNAIKEMTLQDVQSILFGKDTAATHYLREKTSSALFTAFQPKIQSSLDNVNATKYWGNIMGTYNKVPFVKKVDTDLSAFVTHKAIDGLFLKISEQEALIRQNPVERTTDILKKVFGFADKN